MTVCSGHNFYYGFYFSLFGNFTGYFGVPEKGKITEQAA